MSDNMRIWAMALMDMAILAAVYVVLNRLVGGEWRLPSIQQYFGGVAVVALINAHRALYRVRNRTDE